MTDLYFDGFSTLFGAGVVFVALLVAVEIGFRFGMWRRQRERDDPEDSGGDVALSSLLAILGLVLAFTYSAAVHRADARKVAAIDEANAIGTAFLRADLAPESVRTDLRQAILEYGRTRVFVLEEVRGPGGLERALARTAEARSRLWPLVLRIFEQDQVGPVELAVMSSVNEVLDADTTRVAVAFDRLPAGLIGLLVILASVSVGVAGYNSGLDGRLRRWRMAALAGILAILIATILDYDRALRGFFQVSQDAIQATVAEMDRSL